MDKPVTIRIRLRYNEYGGKRAWDIKINVSPRQIIDFRKEFVGGKSAFKYTLRRVKVSPGKPGQELVEFMIVLPILFIILFGVADLARIFHATVAIANAAREGARVGGLDRTDIPSGTATCTALGALHPLHYASCAEGELSGIDISRMTVTANCPDAAGCDAFKPIHVIVTYNFDFLLGNFIPGIGGAPGPSLNLQRTAEMLLQ